MNTAIIVAAGAGTRFSRHSDNNIPKQFLEIAGKPLVIHTIQRFEECPQIDEIVLVLSAAHLESFLQIRKNHNFKKLSKIVEGGASRAESVWNGLTAIDSKTAEIVAVHDGARPLVSVAEISAVVGKAQETGAACLVAPVTDTIKEISANEIVGTIDRVKLRRALTPQCFRYEILRRALLENNLSETATDESYLVERTGVTVSVVEGSSKNIKITHREDFALAEILLRNLENKHV